MRVSFSSLFVALYTLIAGLSVTLYAPEAEACSPPPPGVYGSVPESGAQLPINAAIIFSGTAFGLESFSATLDGVDANLIEIPHMSVPYFSGFSSRMAVMVEPPPVEGQQLSILACVGSMMEETADAIPSGCSQFHFTMTAPDTVPPAAPFSVSFNVHDHADYRPGCCFCQSSSDVAYYVNAVGLEQATSTQAPNFLSVQAFLATDTAEETVFESLTHIDAYEHTSTFRLMQDMLNGGNAADAFCFRIHALDSAMNPSSEPVTVCNPCHVKTTTETISEYEMPPSQPEWTTGDIFVGGSCDSDPCAELDCPDNTHCVPRSSDEGGELTVMQDCVEDEEPVCDKECADGYHCELVTVSCFTSPCPPVDTCVADSTDGGLTGDPCDTFICPHNTHCESLGDTDLNVQDHCVVNDEPECTLECPPGNVCELMTVTCITSPCPPVEFCADLPDSGIIVNEEDMDAGATTEPEETTDAGNTTEPEETTDAGNTTEPEEITDAGNTTEPEETTDAGAEEQEDDSINLDSNLSSSSNMNCECGTTHKRSSDSPLFIMGLLGFVCMTRRRRQKD